MTINTKRLAALVEQPAGLGHLERFLEAVEQELRGIAGQTVQIDAELGRVSQPAGRMAGPLIASEWLRLQADWQRQSEARISEALRQLARHREILQGRTAGRRNRKVDARQRALIERLESDREMLEAAAAAIARSKAQLQNILPALLPQTENELGCSVIDVTP